MRRTVHRSATGLLTLSMLLGTTSVFAQTAIEEIIVSAQKREQSLQDVSVAVTAFSGEEIKKLGLSEPADLAALIPNVTSVNIFGNSLTNFVIRGLGFNDIAPNNGSPAAVHLDEVYFSYSIMLSFALFDIERAEVLKGPQGTLYGRNTTAGAVSFFSVKPKSEFEALISASYGNYQNAELEGYLNVPVNEKIATRFSGYMRQQGSGPFYNRFYDIRSGEVDKYAWRAQVNMKPSEVLEINLNIHGGEENSDKYNYTVSPYGDGTLPLTNNIPCPAYFTGTLQGGESDCFGYLGEQEPDSDPFTNADGQRGRIDHEGYGGNLNVKWDAGFATLTSVSSYDTFDRYQSDDADGFPQQIVDNYYQNEINQYSQEFRLASNGEGPFNWIAGLYWQKDKMDTPVHEAKSFFARNLGVKTMYVQKSETYAGFLHTEYEFDENWRLIAGVRYTWEERFWDGATYLTSGDPNPNESPTIPVTRVAQRTVKKSWENISGKVGIDYMPNEDTLLYASVSKGFKSGGYNGNLAFADVGITDFDEEIVYAYEIGAKAKLLDGRLIWNNSAFYYDYQDIQLIGNSTVIGPGGLPTNVFALGNLADARVYGVETELWWRPMDGLDIKLTGGWLDAKTKNPKPGNEAIDGNDLAYAPEWNTSGVVRYAKPISKNGLLGSVQVDWQYQGDRFANVSNHPVTHLRSYWLFNARVALSAEDSRWEVALWGKNIFDKEYETTATDLGSTRRLLEIYGYPRTYGLELTYKWN